MLRVAAHTCGRSVVDEMDLLLLEHVLWQRPEEAERIRAWLLERLASDKGLAQLEYLMKGLFARACRVENKSDECKALADEAGRLRTVLVEQLGGSVDASSELRSHLWISPANASRAAQTMRPLLSKRRERQEQLLREVVTLQVALEQGMEVHILALLLERQWGDFIRNGEMETVRPHGTTQSAGTSPRI
jgi:MoxR-like ATPase